MAPPYAKVAMKTNTNFIIGKIYAIIFHIRKEFDLIISEEDIRCPAEDQKMEFRFRQAEPEDITKVRELYKDAIQHMINGEIYQWDEQYPNEEVLTGDIKNKEMFLLTGEDKLLACIVINENQDEAYGSAAWKYTGGGLRLSIVFA